MQSKHGVCLFFLLALLASGTADGQAHQNSEAELRLRIVSSAAGANRPVPAVIWLEALPGTPALRSVPNGPYTLLQKNRTFTPHLQVIPVGSVVWFPNADPFFHNVFSLFEGKRFDLGLYEAGSSKSVTFSREGVSYIFCNIHPEMSAVVVALSTPLYAIADAKDSIVLIHIPPGDYRLHLWIEGVPQPVLDGLGRTVHFPPRLVDLGAVRAPIARQKMTNHANEFGEPYDADRQTPY